MSTHRFEYVSSILRRTQTGHMYFECPGCEVPHGLRIVPSFYQKKEGEEVWTWNGNVFAPTFNPSVLVQYTFGRKQEKVVCHSFIRDGMIQFLDDCTHHLKGQTVPIPLWDTTD